MLPEAVVLVVADSGDDSGVVLTIHVSFLPLLNRAVDLAMAGDGVVGLAIVVDSVNGAIDVQALAGRFATVVVFHHLRPMSQTLKIWDILSFYKFWFCNSI